MNDSPQEDKARVRAEMRERLSGLSVGRRATLSASALDRLLGQPRWERARCVLLYAPLKDELDVIPLLKTALAEGKELALPRFEPSSGGYGAALVANLEQDLLVARFGVREPSEACPPVPLNRLDFALVPGIAFTLDGRRLGRGKGYYDRLLASSNGFRCGVGFDQQIVDHLPTEAHDIRLDCILTPTRWCPVDPRVVLK